MEKGGGGGQNQINHIHGKAILKTQTIKFWIQWNQVSNGNPGDFKFWLADTEK